MILEWSTVVVSILTWAGNTGIKGAWANHTQIQQQFIQQAIHECNEGHDCTEINAIMDSYFKLHRLPAVQTNPIPAVQPLPLPNSAAP